jgi:hypothetical protein
MARKENKHTVNTQMQRGKGIGVHPVGGGRVDSNYPPFDAPRSSGGQNDMPNKFFDDLGGRAGATARRDPAQGTVAAGMASPGRGQGMPAAGDRRPKRG